MMKNNKVTKKIKGVEITKNQEQQPVEEKKQDNQTLETLEESVGSQGKTEETLDVEETREIKEEKQPQEVEAGEEDEDDNDSKPTQLSENIELDTDLDKEVKMKTNENSLFEDYMENLDFSQFKSVKSTSKRRAYTEPGVMSIINSDNGKRIQFSKELMEKLKYPETVQVKLFDKGIALSPKFSDNDFNFSIRKEKNSQKGILYAAELVNEIVEEFDLDYSNNKSSLTFHDAKYQMNGEYPVAIIKI